MTTILTYNMRLHLKELKKYTLMEMMSHLYTTLDLQEGWFIQLWDGGWGRGRERMRVCEFLLQAREGG